MLALVLASWLASQAAAAEIPRGQVVERVVCLGDPSQSYALYLPSDYAPDRTWPVLCVFDPRARGRNAIERFTDAAEHYHWIVAGSNNSRNGPLQSSVDAWNAITKDIHERFAVDDKRMYAAGFSGAARAAVYLAAICRGCISGVIVCGAGFPSGFAPSPALRFAVFGAVGVEDLNFAEVKDLDDALAKAGMAHRLGVFEGRHEWVPASMATEAVEWLELRAMQDGTRARDDRVIAAVRQKALARAAALEDAKRTFDAYQISLGAAETLRGLVDIRDIESALTRMRAMPEVKDAIRNEQRQIKKQRELDARIRGLIARCEQRRAQESAAEPDRADHESPNDDSFDPEIQLRVLLADLRRQSVSVEDSGDRRVARRVLDAVFIGLYEQGVDLLQTRRLFAKAARTFTLATEVYPDRGGAFFYLAWAHAAGGERKRALEALKSAVDHGFADLAAITGNTAFDAIRTDPQYEQLVLRLKSPT